MEHTPVAPLWPGQRPAAKSRAPFAPCKPLTTDLLHPLVKAADDELVLRGIAYGTRKSYGQHLYVQELAGHGSIKTTERYTHIPQKRQESFSWIPELKGTGNMPN
jgi:integrase